MADLFKPFLNGIFRPTPPPLGRFLPPLPVGMVSAWINQNLAPGSLVIDALGSTPILALEAARAGCRVLVVSNNPVLSFMLEVLAAAPQAEEFLSAVAELASARRGDERLEVHLQALYQTECPNCAQKIPAQAFVWRKGEKQPFARILRCPFCAQEGEFPIQAADLARLELPGSAGLHRARALERVCDPHEPARAGVEEALQVYLPRPIYFIFTLLNKLEGLGLAPEKQRLLTALVLSMLDEATSLWQHPSGRSRPRQISLPTQFRENNLWMALEGAIKKWSSQPGPIPIRPYSGELPAPGSIRLFQGRLKALSLPPDSPPAAYISVLPRPNQAFWTLSAVWSGWLWGRQAVRPLQGALDRLRYDWHWHAAALHPVFQAMARQAPPGTPAFTLLPELVPGFLGAVVAAAQAGGLSLEGAAIHPSDEFAQLEWRVDPQCQPQTPALTWEKAVMDGIEAELERRSEPAPYLPLYSAALLNLARQRLFPFAQAQAPGEEISHLQAVTSRILGDPAFLLRYEARPQNIESGRWWLAKPAPERPIPLADRVEKEILTFLQKNPGRPQTELNEHLNRQFPGLLTPESDLVRVCLESYGDPASTLPERWQLSQPESPAARRKDLEVIRRGIETLGARLGYRTGGESPLSWYKNEANPGYSFYLLVSGYISRYLLAPSEIPPARCILVLPGGRANLVAFKLQRDPRLGEILKTGWRFLKFRLLRTMLERPELSLNQFEEMLNSDPPRWESESSQPSIFPETP